MSNAAAPTRGDKVTINFGPLVSVPVQVYNGVDENACRIHRNQYTPAGNRTTYLVADAETGEVVSRSDLVMKYTTSDGTAVDLSDDEIAAAMGIENGESELVGVYPMSELAKYAQQGPAQVRPQTQKVGSKTTHPFDKVFALFVGALKDEGAFALVKYVTRGKPKLLAVFGDGSAAFLHWSNEVRQPAPEPIVEVSDAERAAALKLMKSLTQPTAPEPLDNESVEAVREYAELKAVGQAPSGKPKAEVKSADDLMALLEASVTVNA